MPTIELTLQTELVVLTRALQQTLHQVSSCSPMLTWPKQKRPKQGLHAPCDAPGDVSLADVWYSSVSLHGSAIPGLHRRLTPPL